VTVGPRETTVGPGSRGEFLARFAAGATDRRAGHPGGAGLGLAAYDQPLRRTPGVRLPFTSYQMMIAQVRDAVGPVLPGRDPSWRDRRTVGSARWAPSWGDRFATLWLVADKPQQA